MIRLLLFTLCLIPFFINAQIHTLKTYLSFEGGGNGIVASANIGRTLLVKDRFKIIFQTGLGWTPKTALSVVPVNIPSQLTCCFGDRTFFLEAGIGSTVIFESKIDIPESKKSKTELYLLPVLGFRHETERWFGRMYICPLIHATGKHLYDDVTSDFVKIGLSVGTVF
uniref:hypothetical protein n=1 Tax=uncultured Draconibacterium sp. TaxID=1573823 RepID=UPI003217B827